MMTSNRNALAAMLALCALLAGCEDKPAESSAVVQGNAPEGTISDELPNLDLLPNDPPLADPADQGLVPGDPVAAIPERGSSSDESPAAPAPTPAEPAVEGSIAE